jgi:hypothetical protein
MNKHFLKYLLLFISCLFLAYSCVSEEDLLQTDKTEQTKQTFSIFSNSQNIQGKSSKSAIDYAKGFSILMQRYDSIHNTNISGLVNTNNKFEHKKKSHQNVIIENNDYYIENRLHSQTIFEENGDVWVMYPRIKNNSVDGLLIASYTDNGTNVYFSYVKKDSKLYTANINLFQEKYNKQINVSIYNRSNGGLCGYGEEVCELDGPIITPNPGGGGFIYYPGGGDEPSPGGGCSKYQDCEYIDPDGGGGSGDGNVSHTYNEEDKDPSCKSFEFNKVGTANFQQAGVRNISQIFIAKTPSNRVAVVEIIVAELYFGLPVNRANGDFYSTGRAAEISANALGNAFDKVNIYFKNNPFAENSVLEKYFLDALKLEMQKYGGTTSRTPSLGSGYTPTTRDYKSYWFFEDSCDN